MAKCIYCGEVFVSIGNEICMECHDMNDDYPVYDDEPDVDEIQENEDFAHDDDFYNRENDVEDQFLDGSWEDRNEIVDYEGDYFGGDY